MKQTETHTNKHVLRVILAAAAVLLFCGALSGAASAATEIHTVADLTTELAKDNFDIILGDNTDDGSAHPNVYKLTDMITIITSGKLDLNGKVLQQTSPNTRIFRLNAALTMELTDSNPAAKHYFSKDAATGLYKYEGESPADGPIEVDGGCITGGNITEISESGNGGGVWISYQDVTLIMRGGNVVGNMAVDSSSHECKGGGIYDGGRFELKGGQIIGNYADRGAGLQVNVTRSAIMEGGVIAYNSTYNDPEYTTNGGGVYVDGTFTMTGGIIKGNSSARYGGGIYVYGTFILEGGTIASNSAALNGGGVCVNTDGVAHGQFTMTGGVIGGDAESDGNTADQYGGGLFLGNVAEPPVIISGGVIKNNTAHEGGGIYTLGQLMLEPANGKEILIDSNRSAVGTGGIIHDTGAVSSTVVDQLIPAKEQTPATPAPFIGILAGLGAAAGLFSLRRK